MSVCWFCHAAAHLSFMGCLLLFESFLLQKFSHLMQCITGSDATFHSVWSGSILFAKKGPFMELNDFFLELSAQSDQSIHCPHAESLSPKLPIERTVKTEL